MNRSARLRAALASAALTGAGSLLPLGATAQQTDPTPPKAQPNTQPGTTPPATAPPKTNSLLQTPAQEQFGLPVNPQVGERVDEDLSKPLSLQRAVGIGLQRQNSISVSRNQAEAADQRLVQQRASYWFNITPTVRYQSQLNPGTTFINGIGAIPATVNEIQNQGISASINIFDTGQREARVGQSRRSFFASEYALGDQRQAVILSVSENYYNLLRNRELVRVQQANVSRAETTLESIRAQVAVGNAAEADTLQAEADLANARINLLQAQNDARVTEASLKNAMGVVTADPIQIATDPLPPINPNPGSEGLENYVALAYDYRYDLKQQQERINSQGYNVRLSQINAGLTVTSTFQAGYFLHPVAGQQRAFLVGLNYPIFDGGLTRAQVRENRATLDAERRNLDLLEQNARLTVEQAFTTRELSRQRIAAAQLAVRAAQLNYDAALERQRNGVVNILDVVTAQAQLVNAQVQLVQGQYDYYIADARLQRAIGLNDPQYTPRVPNARAPRVTKKGPKGPGVAFAPKKVLEAAAAKQEAEEAASGGK